MENKILYYEYVNVTTDQGCWGIDYTDGDYQLIIRNGKDLRDYCHQFGDADVVDSLLGKLFEALEKVGLSTAGTVSEETWHEPPRLNWRDPSCSDPGDGGVSSAIAHVDPAIADQIDTDLSEVALYLNDAELVAWNSCKQGLTDFIENLFTKVDGTDIHQQ